MPERRLIWRRSRGRVALVLGVGALAAALVAAVHSRPPVAPRFSLTAGAAGTTRAIVAQRLVSAAAARGVEGRLVETDSTRGEIELVESGEVDCALVSGAYRFTGWRHVREVVPLYVEALHLLVKEELAQAVTESLGALGGHTVELGPVHTTSAGLAAAVLGFAELETDDGAGRVPVRTQNTPLPEIEAVFARGDRSVLPDAVFLLATLPSTIALQLVRHGGYRVIPLPFADAFRLGALVTDAPARGAAAEIERQYVSDTVIPAFTYDSEPAVPPEPVHTLGTRLLLVANARLAPAVVEAVLDVVFSPRFARIMDPPLERGVLAEPPQLELHAGTVGYVAHEQPVITNEGVDRLSNTFSILGALIGGGLFLRQWWRQRAALRRDEVFGGYMLRVASIERRTTELELAATLELEPLADLQRELLNLKREALERFAAGELGGQAALADLLTPLNGAREHIGELILHVRTGLEAQAEAEGRKAEALWEEAIDKSDEASGKGDEASGSDEAGEAQPATGTPAGRASPRPG